MVLGLYLHWWKSERQPRKPPSMVLDKSRGSPSNFREVERLLACASGASVDARPARSPTWAGGRVCRHGRSGTFSGAGLAWFGVGLFGRVRLAGRRRLQRLGRRGLSSASSLSRLPSRCSSAHWERPDILSKEGEMSAALRDLKWAKQHGKGHRVVVQANQVP